MIPNQQTLQLLLPFRHSFTTASRQVRSLSLPPLSDRLPNLNLLSLAYPAAAKPASAHETDLRSCGFQRLRMGSRSRATSCSSSASTGMRWASTPAHWMNAERTCQSLTSESCGATAQPAISNSVGFDYSCSAVDVTDLGLTLLTRQPRRHPPRHGPHHLGPARVGRAHDRHLEQDHPQGPPPLRPRPQPPRQARRCPRRPQPDARPRGRDGRRRGRGQGGAGRSGGED